MITPDTPGIYGKGQVEDAIQKGEAVGWEQWKLANGSTIFGEWVDTVNDVSQQALKAGVEKIFETTDGNKPPIAAGQETPGMLNGQIAGFPIKTVVVGGLAIVAVGFLLSRL